jgi:magnesium transporter
MSVRRLAASHRDVVMKLSRRDTPFIPDDLVVYLLDVYDHLTRISSDVDNNSDLISSALDIHLNEVSNRMNVTMKRLTAVATIFMPLTFIVGLYGMNFRVPEYRWFYGYLYVWILMIVVSVVMIIIAKKSDWF